MGHEALTEFFAEERLPDSFVETVDVVCRPLAGMARALASEHGSARLGICGPQGSGKSTIAKAVARILRAEGLSVAAISLDDFYLPREARMELARTQPGPVAVRGPPGSHDVEALLEALDSLARPGPVALPTFDKARDTVAPRAEWPTVAGPAQVTILEGWCVGARPQPAEALVVPINNLEREADADGRWRRRVNDLLAGPYADAWGRLHALAYLQPPGFEVVAGWRAEQEAKLRARTGQGMSDAEIVRFVAHYERLTRWMIEDMPNVADRLFRLDAERRPTAV